jgi:hypothetical protein
LRNLEVRRTAWFRQSFDRKLLSSFSPSWNSRKG